MKYQLTNVATLVYAAIFGRFRAIQYLVTMAGQALISTCDATTEAAGVGRYAGEMYTEPTG